MSYYEKLSQKPIRDEIDEGTHLVGVQVNEEGEEIVSRYPANAIDNFKNKKAEEARTKAETAQAKSEAAQVKSEEAAESILKTKNDIANALKGKTSGEAIAITDASPIEHEMGVKVWGKNLLNSSLRLTQKTDNGLTIQYLPDEDCYLLNGTTTKAGDFYRVSEDVLIDGKVTASVKVLSGSIDNPNGGYTRLQLAGRDDLNAAVSNWSDALLEQSGSRTSSTVKKYLSTTWFHIDGGITFNNYKVQLQIERGDTATAYTPYIEDFSTVKVLKYGKNILGYTYHESTLTVCGITFTDNGDGTITANGTATARAQFLIIPSSANFTLRKGTYTVSGCPKGGGAATYGIWTSGGQEYGEGKTFDYNGGTFFFNITIVAGATVNNLVFKPMLELESGDKVFTPYIAPIEYPISADGTVEGVCSIYPATTLMTDTAGAVIDCTYNRDINKAFEELYNAIISTGGNV